MRIRLTGPWKEEDPGNGIETNFLNFLLFLNEQWKTENPGNGIETEGKAPDPVLASRETGKSKLAEDSGCCENRAPRVVRHKVLATGSGGNQGGYGPG